MRCFIPQTSWRLNEGPPKSGHVLLQRTLRNSTSSKWDARDHVFEKYAFLKPIILLFPHIWAQDLVIIHRSRISSFGEWKKDNSLALTRNRKQLLGVTQITFYPHAGGIDDLLRFTSVVQTIPVWKPKEYTAFARTGEIRNACLWFPCTWIYMYMNMNKNHLITLIQYKSEHFALLHDATELDMVSIVTFVTQRTVLFLDV